MISSTVGRFIEVKLIKVNIEYLDRVNSARLYVNIFANIFHDKFRFIPDQSQSRDKETLTKYLSITAALAVITIFAFLIQRHVAKRTRGNNNQRGCE